MKTPLEQTRQSWNIATLNHNAHKGDQAARLRGGEEFLFPEELEILGDLAGKKLVHLQCNSGQDSLCLARRGADVTGIDFSDEAIGFAQRLSQETGLKARFIEAEVVSWLEETAERFDLAFSSYGAAGWLPDLERWARGIHRVLRPGGRFVYVEFHPLVWSVGPSFRLEKDDYFAEAPFVEPVNDYVAGSGSALGAISASPQGHENVIPAVSWQYGLAKVLNALAQSGLMLESVQEYPYANGCKLHSGLVASTGRRWEWPSGIARTPLMFGVSFRKNASELWKRDGQREKLEPNSPTDLPLQTE